MTTEPSATERFLRQSLATVRRQYQEKRDQLDDMQGTAAAVKRQMEDLKKQRDELIRDMKKLEIKP